MKRLALLVVPFLLLLTSISAFAQAATVATRTTAALGTFLTTPGDLALYTFTGDTSGVSNVTGSLAAVWPPFTATGALTLPAGVGGTLTQITRSDGTQQVAYNGHPLYTFTGDAPGVVNGQGGAGGRFFVATAMVTAATATPSAAVTATPVATASATAVATATATASATALPVSGEPTAPLAPTVLLGVGALGLGLVLRLRRAGAR